MLAMSLCVGAPPRWGKLVGPNFSLASDVFFISFHTGSTILLVIVMMGKVDNSSNSDMDCAQVDTPVPQHPSVLAPDIEGEPIQDDVHAHTERAVSDSASDVGTHHHVEPKEKESHELCHHVHHSDRCAV